jgi:hypothetical protein
MSEGWSGVLAESTCCLSGELSILRTLPSRGVLPEVRANGTSSDQTTRIHASTSLPGQPPRWAEIARPQVHGYDLTCAAWLSPYRFASGADEKVTRVFDAPGGFVESLSSLGAREMGGEDAVRCLGLMIEGKS